MTKTVHRHEIPVDGQPHTVKLTHSPHAIATTTRSGSHIVELWAEHDPAEHATARTFTVYGTGHDIPATARWRGTTARVDGLVWHLFELPGDTP